MSTTSQLLTILQDLAPSWLKNLTPTLTNVVALVMGIIDKADASLSAADKITAVINFLPTALNALVDLKILTSAQAESITNQITADSTIVTNTIQDILQLSKNPTFIDAENWLESEISTSKCSCLSWLKKIF
jgi:hypothetical protein